MVLFFVILFKGERWKGWERKGMDHQWHHLGFPVGGSLVKLTNSLEHHIEQIYETIQAQIPQNGP